MFYIVHVVFHLFIDYGECQPHAFDKLTYNLTTFTHQNIAAAGIRTQIDCTQVDCANH